VVGTEMQLYLLPLLFDHSVWQAAGYLTHPIPVLPWRRGQAKWKYSSTYS